MFWRKILNFWAFLSHFLGSFAYAHRNLFRLWLSSEKLNSKFQAILQKCCLLANFGMFCSLVSLTLTPNITTKWSPLDKILPRNFKPFLSYCILFMLQVFRIKKPGWSLWWEKYRICIFKNLAGLTLIKMTHCFILRCSTQWKKNRSFEFGLGPRLLTPLFTGSFNDNNSYRWVIPIKLALPMDLIISNVCQIFTSIPWVEPKLCNV